MKEQVRVRHLPHWDLPGATYFVTTCLADSIPAQGLLDLKEYQATLEKKPCPAGLARHDWELRKWKLLFARRDDWLDRALAARYLAEPSLATVVRDSLYHLAGIRYDLLSYVVMPSHVHWVFRPRDEWVASLGETVDDRTPRERIMHSLKRHCARECNTLLGRKGAFWQDESYDHCVRDVDELERIILYVEYNPVKAGLVSAPELWPFSSAKDRRDWGLTFGDPLLLRRTGL